MILRRSRIDELAPPESELPPAALAGAGRKVASDAVPASARPLVGPCGFCGWIGRACAGGARTLGARGDRSAARQGLKAVTHGAHPERGVGAAKDRDQRRAVGRGLGSCTQGWRQRPFGPLPVPRGSRNLARGDASEEPLALLCLSDRWRA